MTDKYRIPVLSVSTAIAGVRVRRHPLCPLCPEGTSLKARRITPSRSTRPWPRGATDGTRVHSACIIRYKLAARLALASEALPGPEPASSLDKVDAEDRQPTRPAHDHSHATHRPELKLATYKELLVREKEDHSLNVSELERRDVMEKDRLKNEMLRKIRETKLSLLAMTEGQLHTITKRTIMENEQMTTELQYQSKETERIVRRNSKLATENSNLQRELELAADTLQQMAKKTILYPNLLTKLQGKIDVMQLERG